MKISIVLGLTIAGLVYSDSADPYYARAIELMRKTPLLDTHIDLPQIIRSLGKQRLRA